MKKHYEVVGTIAELDLRELITEKENSFDVNKEKLKFIVSAALSTLIFSLVFQDPSLAANGEMIQTASSNFKTPTQLNHILEFVSWIIDLLKYILSGIAGLICTFAGYKWATSLEGNGQEAAKKILKNAFVGGVIVWTGSSIAGFFVDKMNEILG
ncbi:gp150 [Bacillus phage G]|uniref:Gp150 n=1 Tax=Bacillus phage G TaxID=2884420 RepID=G3MBL6_9CAUD|nr:gp150 [Bacillus phage G]AEO93410.1 gp150 [Bacillus phage G]